MPIPKAVARFDRIALNRLTRPIAAHAPGFGVVVHRGRRSGRTYETPVNVFPSGSGVRIALTYGADSEWVKNVLAAGGCTVRTRGRDRAMTEPRIVHDPARSGTRAVERRLLGLMHVDQFLDLTG